MADGSEYPERVATQRELDAAERHLQKQIDQLDERFRDVREELRRMGEAVQKGMAEIAHKLEGLSRPLPPPPSAPPITQIVRDELAQLHKGKQGTPGWVYMLIVVGGVLAFLFFRRLGLL